MAVSQASSGQSARAIFLDKDGTLIDDVPYNVNPALIRLSRQAGPALRMLQEQGYRLIVVTNQSGVARGLFTEDALGPVHTRLAELLTAHGVRLDGFYYCPHSIEGTVARYTLHCACRKPMPGLLLQAAQEHGVDLAQSWMIGDILNDVEAGHRAGCRSVLIDNGNETEWLGSPLRQPDLFASDLYGAATGILSIGETLAQAEAAAGNSVAMTPSTRHERPAAPIP